MKKTFKQLGAMVAVLLAILIATAFTPPAKNASSVKDGDGLAALDASFADADAARDEEALQCGVTNAQIIEYLQGAPHYHTVYWVQDIPGTCNSKAGIEFGKTATVYVSGGAIVGHTDSSGYGDNSSNSSSEGPK